MLDENALERLVPARDVFEALVREYERLGTFNDMEFGKQFHIQNSAMTALLTRLASGYLEAVASTCSIDSTRDTGAAGDGKIIATWDFHQQNTPAVIPIEFWRHFRNAGTTGRTFDPITGDFTFDYLDTDYSNRDGVACGVFFDPRGLPAIDVRPEAPPAGAVKFSDQPRTAETPAANLTTMSASPKASDDKRPLPESMLNSWWEWLDDETRQLGHDDLWDLCRSAFCRHTISRQRIRDLSPDRKRGPKPIR